MGNFCKICGGSGWVCENCQTTWELESGGTCCGAGIPCDCNADANVDWLVVHASLDGDIFDKRN